MLKLFAFVAVPAIPNKTCEQIKKICDVVEYSKSSKTMHAHLLPRSFSPIQSYLRDNHTALLTESLQV